MREAATMDCQTATTVNLSAPAVPIIQDIITSDPTDCFETDGSLEVLATGMNLEYSLDGLVWQASNFFFDLPQGNYTVQVREAAATDCIAMQDATLTDPPVPVILDIILENPSCTNDNGSITIVVQNAGASTEYSIDGGNNFFPIETFTALASGDYDVVVREAATMDCTTATTVSLTQLESLQTNCTVSLPASQAGASDGEITIEIIGGIPPYTYSWAGPVSGMLTVDAEGVYTIPNLPEGDYSISTSDSSVCPDALCVGSVPIVAGACNRLQDSLALVELFFATDGPNWLTSWDLEQPMDTWFGVTLSAEGCVTEIDLPSNNLLGQLTPSLGTLSEIERIALMSNSLFGNLPPEWGNALSLESIQLSNNQLIGGIPAEWGSLVNLRFLSITFNTLDGPIPPEIGNLISLETLLLFSNELTGPIPPEIGSLINLTSLSLSDNQLTGNIPMTIGNLVGLTNLSLHTNQLDGVIPLDLGLLINLQNLFLQRNQLNGTIPTELANLQNLARLNLSNNQLEGTIPSSIGSLLGLSRLYLFNNQLSGDLPFELGALINLERLYVHDNQLSGCFPSELMVHCVLGFSNNPDQDGYNFTGNPLLPWSGDFAQFCATDGTQLAQIGAFCDDGNALTTGETIQDDCACALIVDCTDSDLTFAFGDLQGPSCSISDNGFATVVPFLGVEPYSYLWSNGDTSPTATNLAEGTYSFTITDGEGCTVDGSVNLEAFNPIELVCPENISLLIEADSTGIYLDIPGPDTGACPLDSVRHFATGATVLADTAGIVGIEFFNVGLTTVTYYVPGVDTCTFTIEILQVVDPCADFAVFPNMVQSPVCNDGDDGFIELTVTGGDGDYTFNWSNGDDTEDISNLGVGLYVVTITDGNACEVTASFWLQGANEFRMNCVGIPFANYGQQFSTIQLNINGGVAPYEVSYSGPETGSISGVPEGLSIIPNLPAGAYNVQVTDADGCMIFCDVIIENPCTVFECPDNQVIFIEADSLGIFLDIPAPNVGDCGINLIQHNLSGATVIGDTPGAVGIQFFNTGVTTVSYFVPGVDTCTFTIEVLKVVDPCDDFAVVPNTVQSPLCVDGNDGIVQITVSGGDGNYNYEWSNGADQEDLFNLGAGLYTVTITDGNGCEVSASFWLQAPDELELSCTSSPTTAIGQTDGSILIDYLGGTPPYSASYTGPANGNVDGLLPGQFEFTDLPAGDYLITLTDAEFCTVTCQVVIDAGFDCNDLMIETMVEGEFCQMVNGAIFVTVSGGSGDYSYLWEDGSMEPDFITLAAGTYSLTVTDNQTNCIDSLMITVPDIGLPDQVTIEETICAGESYPFDGQNLTETGVYTGNFINQAGCDSTVTLTLTVIELAVEIMGDTTYCENEIGVHRFEVDWDGAIEWSTGSTQDFVDVLPMSGALSVTITDANGCEATDVVNLELYETPQIEIQGTLEVCGDDLAQVSASGGVNYLWSTGAQTPNVMLPAGIHAVTVYSAEACESVELVEIIGYDPPVLPSYQALYSICDGIIPTIDVITQNPTHLVDWYDSDNTFLLTAPAYQPTVAGTYFAWVRDANTDCLSTEAAVIEVEEDMIPPTVENCPEEAIEVVWNMAMEVIPDLELPEFTFTDNCGVVSSSSGIEANPDYVSGTVAAFATAMDAAGNVDSCNFEFTIIKTDDLTFLVDTTNIENEDSMFMVPIQVLSFDSVSGFQFTMMLSDSSGGAIENVQVLEPQLMDGFTFNIENDTTLRVLWSDLLSQPNSPSITLADSTPIFAVEMTLPGDFGACSMFMFADDPVNKVAIRDGVGEVIPSTIDGEVCIPEVATLSGRIYREDDQGVGNVEITLLYENETMTTSTTSDGNYEFKELPLGFDYTIVPFKNDNHPNGLSLVDITRIRDYVLFGDQSIFLQTPYRKISADASNNEFISLTDLTTLIILRVSGPSAVLPNNTSWRFVDAFHEFSNPNIPWLGGFPEDKTIANLVKDTTDNDFVAMKIGDVNLTASTLLQPENPFPIEITDQELIAGETILVPITAKNINELIGMELDLVFDPSSLKFKQLIAGDMPLEDYHFNQDRVQEGVLSGLWLNFFNEDFGTEDLVLFQIEFLVGTDGMLHEQISLGYEYMESIGVTTAQDAVPLEIVFTDAIVSATPASSIVQNMRLLGAFPNPFDEATNIHFHLPMQESVRLEVYDLSGQLLYSGEQPFTTGYQAWPIREQELSAKGIFFYRLSANGKELYGKMIRK